MEPGQHTQDHEHTISRAINRGNGFNETSE